MPYDSQQAHERPQEFWDRYFLKIADAVASASKDPSTKVGAVIVNPSRRIVSTGYNGFPSGLIDDPQILANREQKYKHTIHAELNAILNSHSDLTNCTLYCTPLSPCHECAKAIIQSGIIRVVVPRALDSLLRWESSQDLANNFFLESKIAFNVVTMAPEDN